MKKKGEIILNFFQNGQKREMVSMLSELIFNQGQWKKVRYGKSFSTGRTYHILAAAYRGLTMLLKGLCKFPRIVLAPELGNLKMQLFLYLAVV